MNDIPDNNDQSDYGILNPELCDPGLRSRVIAAINPQNALEQTLNKDQVTEVATYITQLEDALLRHHWGSMNHHEVLELLKCKTGLDIEGRMQQINAMVSEDA